MGPFNGCSAWNHASCTRTRTHKQTHCIHIGRTSMENMKCISVLVRFRALVSVFFSKYVSFHCCTSIFIFNKIECDYILAPHERKKSDTKLVFRTNWHEIALSKWKLVCLHARVSLSSCFFQISSTIFVALHIARITCFAFILPIAVSIFYFFFLFLWVLHLFGARSIEMWSQCNHLLLL